MLKEQLNTKKYDRNIIKLYLYAFFHNLIFAYIIERLFALERGLNVQQMVYVEIIYAFFIMLLEIPSGVLADYWKRKNVMILSSVFSFFEILILVFAENFWFFGFSALSASFSGALASGTANALLYDSLKMKSREKDFEKVCGRQELFSDSAAVIAALIGSWLGIKMGFGFNYFLSLFSVIISLMIIISVEEPEIKTDEKEEENSFITIFREAFNFLKVHQQVRFIMLYSVINVSVIIYIDEYWQIYFQESNIPVYLYGIFSGFNILSSGSMAFYAYKLKEKFSYRQIFNVSLCLLIIFTILSSFNNNFYGIFLLLPLFIINEAIYPLSHGYMHHRVESKYRATVESFVAMAQGFISVSIGLAFGYISTSYSVHRGFLLLGLILLLYSIYYFINVFSEKDFYKPDR